MTRILWVSLLSLLMAAHAVSARGAAQCQSRPAFRTACENQSVLSESQRQSIQRLLLTAEAESCQEADRKLREQKILDLSDGGFGLPIFSDLAFLKGFNQIEELAIDLTHVSDFKPLEELISLKVLRFTAANENGHKLKDFSTFPRLPKLESLESENLAYCHLESFRGIWKFPRVQRVQFSFCSIRSLDALRSARQLKVLHISESQILDLNPLEGLSQLEYLDIAYPQEGYRVKDVSVVRTLPRLKSFFAAQQSIAELEAFRNHPALELIELHGNGVRDVGPLETIPSLAFIDMNDNEIKAIEGLAKLPHVRRLTVEGNPLEDKTCPWPDTALGPVCRF